MAKIISDLHQTENSIESALKSIVDGNDKIAQLRGELGAISANLEGLINRRKEVDKNINEKEQSADELKARLDSVKEKVSEFENSIKETQDKISKTSQKLQQTSLEKTEQLNELEKVKHDLTVKQTRRASLLALKESFEGYQSGTKSLLQGKKSKISDCAGVVTTVAEIIRTDSKYELAIEVALGNALNYLVTDTVDQAITALSYLGKQKSGMATILPLEIIRSNETSQSDDSLRSGQGVIGPATELVKYDKKYKSIIQALLSHVLIVKDLDSALQLQSKNSSSWELVTIAGERVNGFGAISGGAVKTPGLLALDREIEELTGNIKDLEKDLTSVMSKIGSFDSQLATLEQERTELQQHMHQLDIRRAEAQRDTETFSTQQKHIADEIDMLSTVQENNLSEEETQKSRQKQMQDELNGLETQLTQTQ